MTASAGRLQGPNGLFFGDATGCSKTCITGADLPRPARRRRPAPSSCGNGNVETGEDCDDGNLATATAARRRARSRRASCARRRCAPDTEACSTGDTASACKLPVIYRDFKNESESGGHPDFFYLGAPVTPAAPTASAANGGSVTFNKRYCVPNSSGPAKENDSTARCWDLAPATLGANGKPIFNRHAPAARSATASSSTGATTDQRSLTFRDMATPAGGAHLNGLPYHANPAAANGAPWCTRASAPIVTRTRPASASGSIDSTFTGSDPRGRHARDGPARGGGQYQFSSQLARGLRRLLPARSDGPVSARYQQRDAGGPGRDAGWSGRRADALQPVAVLVLEHVVRGRGSSCNGDQYLFPPSVTPDDGESQRHVGHRPAGLVPRLLVHQRGALPVQLQRGRSACSSTATTTCSSSSTGT